MSVIGSFPLNDVRRRVIRAPVNPLDKATIVSILPKEIDETKPTIQPGRFIIAPGTYEKPALLVVGPSSWWREVDEDQPLLEIPVSSIMIAESVVKDYANGLLGYNQGDTGPGLFFVPGELNAEAILKTYKNELDRVNQRQKNWFELLVRLADSLWARSNGNPLAISDDMRMAARQLNMQDTKDWMSSHKMMEMVRCKACGALKSPEYPVCSQCRAIDETHPNAKNLKFA